MITQIFDLNLIPNQAPVIIHVDQYDVGTGRLIAHLYKGDTAYTPAAGATAMVQGTKPDGRGFDYWGTISGNTVTMDLTEQMSMVAGRVRVQIVITEGNNRTGTFVFILDVQKSALPADTDMSASEYQIVEELLETAMDIGGNLPYIGANGNWWIWSVPAGAYIDSGVDASITMDIADVTMLQPTDNPYVTNTGTSTDAIFHLFIPRGQTGSAGPAGNGIVSIAKTGTSGLVDTYTITYTNGNTDTFTVTNGQDGQGSGDMTKAVYDSANTVANAGGITSYVTGRSIGDFSDVTITSAATGQVLSKSSDNWVNAYLSGLKYDASNTLADIIGNVETLLAAL